MSSPSTGFDPNTFLSQLDNYNFSVDPSAAAYGTSGDPADSPTAAPALKGLYQEWLFRTAVNSVALPTTAQAGSPNEPNDALQFTAEMKKLFAAWDAGNQVDPSGRIIFPRTWGDFITEYRTFFGIYNNPGAAGAGITSSNVLSGPAYVGFLTEFSKVVQLIPDFIPINAQTDFGQDEFVNSFGAFLSAYPFTSAPDAHGNVSFTQQSLDLFIQNWRHFMTVTAVNLNVTTSPSLSTPGADYTKLITYEQAFKAFFPNASQQDFINEIESFVNEVDNDMQNGGYFLPSQLFERFFAEIKDKYLITKAVIGTVQANNVPKLDILWKVFALIVTMITSIQKVTAIEAQRIGFLTNYQKAYTELISAIPTFAAGHPFDDPTSVNSQNQAWAESLRAFQGVVTDSSKGLQSSVNTLNQASQDQATVATNMLQQMQSIMQIISK